jgi:hypothetical protein
VDSNLGLQVDARINDWLSLTGQGLVRKFGEDDYGADATLAFAKFKWSDTLSVRAGRVPLAVFMVSDYRNVGYANTMVRPSQEVYSQVPTDRLDGVDLEWRQNIGASTLTTQLAYGSASITLAGGDGTAKITDSSVVNLILEHGPFTLRFGRNDAKLSLDQSFFQLPKTKVSFTAVGFSMDWKDIVVQTEYTRARGFAESNGWYAMGGYRLGKVLPYVSHGKLSGMNAQTTDSVGVRWDAFRSADIKFQVDRVDPQGPGTFVQIKPGFHGPVTVGTLAVDFVF